MTRPWAAFPSIPSASPDDETFNVGQGHAHRVAMIEYCYNVPFKFTGKIDKLTFKLQRRSTQRESRRDERIGVMKIVLVLAAVGEAATGMSLLIAPSLVASCCSVKSLSASPYP